MIIARLEKLILIRCTARDQLAIYKEGGGYASDEGDTRGVGKVEGGGAKLRREEFFFGEFQEKTAHSLPSFLYIGSVWKLARNIVYNLFVRDICIIPRTIILLFSLVHEYSNVKFSFSLSFRLINLIFFINLNIQLNISNELFPHEYPIFKETRNRKLLH